MCFKSKPKKGGREETDSPKTPFWTTVSPHDAFAAPLARSDFLSLRWLSGDLLGTSQQRKLKVAVCRVQESLLDP